MNKRPLCLVCLCFMICIWLFEMLGITDGGNPLNYQEFETCVKEHSYASLSGEVFRYDLKADGTSYLYVTSTVVVVSTKQFSNHTIRIKLEKEYPLSIGNRVQVTGFLYEMPKATNPGQFDLAQYYRLQGLTGFLEGEHLTVISGKKQVIRDFLWRLRERCKEILVTMAPANAGVLSAMLLGDKSLLEEEIKEQYRLTGILHILAVSGTHLAVISGMLYQILMKIGFGRRGAGSFVLVLMIFYGVFTGGSISVIRSVVMFGLSVGAEILGRTYDMLSAMSLSAVFLLVEHPGYLYDSGFLLSFGAVLGLALFMPVLGEKWKALKGGIAVLLIQLPILQYYYFEIPICSLLTNLIVMPLVPIVLGCGMLGLAAGAVFQELGEIILIPAQLVLDLYELLGVIAERMPGTMWITGQPEVWQIICYGCLLICGALLHHRIKTGGFAVFAVAAILLLSFRMPTGFRLTMLDVGQGDGLVLDVPSGNHYLIDGGSTSVGEVGKYRIVPYLKSQGITHLEGIFVTHGDEDHINGLSEVFDTISVKYLFLPEWMGEKEDQFLQKRAEEEECKIIYLRKGDRIQDGEVSIDVLHPDSDTEAYLEDENSGSLTLYVVYQEFSALLTGDLGGDAEAKVAVQEIDCQLLKIGHHGSDTSTSEELLHAASPDIALISCGENNRYGHPAPQVVERLEDAGVMIKDTRKCGAVTVESDGNKIWIKVFIDKALESRYRKPYEKYN